MQAREIHHQSMQKLSKGFVACTKEHPTNRGPPLRSKAPCILPATSQASLVLPRPTATRSIHRNPRKTGVSTEGRRRRRKESCNHEPNQLTFSLSSSAKHDIQSHWNHPHTPPVSKKKRSRKNFSREATNLHCIKAAETSGCNSKC